MSKTKRIPIAWIGEWDGNPVPWFRQLIGVDGTEYRLYHRRGQMYCFNVKTDEILLEREEGGPDDMAGSDQQVLEQISDVFEKPTDGKICVICRAIFPYEQVPLNCLSCGTAMRMRYVVSLRRLNPHELTELGRTHPVFKTDLELPGENDKHIYSQLEEASISGAWALQDELGGKFIVLVTTNYVIGYRAGEQGPTEVLAIIPLSADEAGTFGDWMLSSLVLEEGMLLDLDPLQCRSC